MGLLLGAIERKAQLKQQQKLQNMQIAGQKEMGKFNQEQQLEMWHKTNYGPQMEELRKAGLNPGLIYGMSGGGGVTASSNPGSVSGGSADGKTPAAGMGMALGQAALMAAQVDLIKAQTEKTKADTGLTGVNTDLAKLEKDLKEYALPNAKSMTDQELSKLRTEVQNMWIQRDILEGTKDTQIQQQKANLTATYAEIALKQAGVGKTEEETKKIAAEIGQMVQKLANETKQVEIQQQMADFQTKWGNDAGTVLRQVLGGIIKFTPVGGGK